MVDKDIDQGKPIEEVEAAKLKSATRKTVSAQSEASKPVTAKATESSTARKPATAKAMAGKPADASKETFLKNPAVAGATVKAAGAAPTKSTGSITKTAGAAAAAGAGGPPKSPQLKSTGGAGSGGPGKRGGKDDINEEEERRRRIILALWLAMFAILVIVFVWVFFGLFATDRGQTLAQKKCLQCHGKEMARQLGSQYLHEPFGEEDCTSCHVEPKTADKACDAKKRIYAVLSGNLNTVCNKCHTTVKTAMSKKFVHRPFKGKRCTDCHDPHASQFERLTILPAQELCVSCHYGTDFMQLFQHQPAQKRNCIDCHEPHASDEFKDLVLPVSQLCYSCHFRVAQQNLRLYKHKPFLDSNCIACHKPHSSPTARLLTMEYNTLCESCHPNIGVDFQRVSHHPLGVEPMKNCGACHLYHSADWPKLLPLSNTVNCYQSQCHPGLQAYFDTSEHNSTVMGMLAKKSFAVTCSVCHSPHGAASPNLLIIDKYTICLTCHASVTGDTAHGVFAHIYSPPFIDRWHGGYMWCGSCHNFHGSAYPAMRLALGDDLCLKCHTPSDLENAFR